MSLIDDILSDELPGPLKEAFGDSITYTHKPSNTAETVTVIFSDPDPLQPAYPGTVSLLDVLISDLSPAPVAGDEVTFGSNIYVVTGNPLADKIGPSGLFVRLCLRLK